MSETLTVCISGSFKFKPEIDGLHDEFASYGATVLEPTRGWLYTPSRLPNLTTSPSEFRPLPHERGMTEVQVEDRYLSAVRKADFMYLFNKYGYLGNMAAYETGWAYGIRTPTFALQPLTLANFDYELDTWRRWSKRVIVAPPPAAVECARLIKNFRTRWSGLASTRPDAI